jgi:ribonuclease VapC
VIAVDTSALIAIVLREEAGPSCMDALKADDHLLISAGTLTETLIVAQARHRGEDLQRILDGLGFEIVPVDGAVAQRAAAAHARWGRGAKTAGLNFGDCFAYDVAKQNHCALLYVGRDFAKTDVKSAL